MTPKFKFADGEKVLCFHGPLIYEAKALKSQVTKDKQVRYFIHYAGWNKNWDEWVPENRVLKFNDQNCQRQKEVCRQHQAALRNSKKSTPKGKKSDGTMPPKDGDSRASTPSKELLKETSGTTTPTATTPAPTPTGRGRPAKNAGTPASTNNNNSTPTTTAAVTVVPPVATTANSTPPVTATTTASTTGSTTPVVDKIEDGPKKKRGKTESINNSSTSTVESEEQFLSKMEIKIKIPDELKQSLVDDWDAITRQHKVVDIPSKISVQDIIDNYVAFKKSSKNPNPTKDGVRTDISSGLIEYFNVMLGSQLLYKFERPQYAEILHEYPNKPMSKLYGSFHLLRLFVKLGQMLAYTSLDERYVQTLLLNLNDFFKYLVKNNTLYFNLNNFVNASPEYHRRTQ